MGDRRRSQDVGNSPIDRVEKGSVSDSAVKCQNGRRRRAADWWGDDLDREIAIVSQDLESSTSAIAQELGAGRSMDRQTTRNSIDRVTFGFAISRLLATGVI